MVKEEEEEEYDCCNENDEGDNYESKTTFTTCASATGA